MANYIIYGGTFDPIHNGHIRIANYASKKFNADVILVPAKNPRWKDDVTPVEHRLKMLKLSLKYLPSGTSISKYEIKSNDEINYSINTLRYFAKKYKNDKLYFIIGGDQVDRFHEWKDCDEIASLSQIVYCARPGVTLDKNNIDRFHMISLDFNNSGEVSSTSIRELKSLDMPLEVLEYIENNNLYFIGKVGSYITEKRLNHSIQVAKVAYRIAISNNIENPSKYYVAGILHDVGKLAKIDDNNAINYMQKNFPEYVSIPKFAYHQFIGSDIAKKHFGIEDADILDAIKFHCTGKANMSQLGMVVYASDKIEPTREYDSRFLINSCLADWKQGFLDTLNDNKKYLLAHAKDITNKLTDECFEMYLKEIK